MNRALNIRIVLSAHSSARQFSTDSVRLASDRESWLSKLLYVRTIDPGKSSHSQTLADPKTEKIYELQIHSAKPKHRDAYVSTYQKYVEVLPRKVTTAEHIGSWQVVIGDQDQFVHVWRHSAGYPSASETIWAQQKDNELRSLICDQNQLIRSRENTFMLAFTFWGHPEAKENGGIYEMRSYVLKPGTMSEWGNNWARGITFRRENAVAGFFTQIGQLHCVYHFWTYKSLTDRKETRERNWQKPGWDECVAYTVPLIREMRSRWLFALPFSPLK
ncbi:protein NipSnap-like [Tropilaelaps mercedesae]|uniref:Protein NipSnap-like n=1 Tax=Tropilaelaps mercedesae TaxID=418985 RepID=A0A1V9XWV2_9ACAR|nr:protein NipSnap-like [Tropilaelaps mercedesae]